MIEQQGLSLLRKPKESYPGEMQFKYDPNKAAHQFRMAGLKQIGYALSGLTASLLVLKYAPGEFKLLAAGVVSVGLAGSAPSYFVEADVIQHPKTLEDVQYRNEICGGVYYRFKWPE